MAARHSHPKGRPKTKFHYSSYWMDWSRVLADPTDAGLGNDYIEVNLTPIPHSYGSTWDTHVRQVRIRRHWTARATGDIECDELPAQIRQKMVEALGEEKTNRLLTEDFLPQIDWEAFKQRNGGANLGDILKAA